MAAAGVEPRALEYLQRAPKVELHVHLEGGLRRERLLAILRRHGEHPHLRSVQDLAHLYRHADFAEFLEHFRWAVTCLRDVEDVHGVALDLFRDLALQNIVYAEVIFSPGIFTRRGMPLGELLAAVTAAADDAPRDAPRAAAPAAARPPQPRYNLVIDLVRNFGPQSALALVEELGREAHPRVVGVHLGGDEVGFPARLFGAAFAAARALGLGLAAHAGEAAGPESVREAIEVLHATRLGHGVRSLEDADLVRELVRRGTTLEICPTSNVCTGIVPSLALHPLPELLRRGVRATLGSDDPAYFDTDLGRELRAVHQHLGLDLQTIDRLVDAGLEAAFVPEPERAARLAALRAERAQLRSELGLSGPAAR